MSHSESAQSTIRDAWAAAVFWGRVGYIAKVVTSVAALIAFYASPPFIGITFTALMLSQYTDNIAVLIGLGSVITVGLYTAMTVAFKEELSYFKGLGRLRPDKD